MVPLSSSPGAFRFACGLGHDVDGREMPNRHFVFAFALIGSRPSEPLELALVTIFDGFCEFFQSAPFIVQARAPRVEDVLDAWGRLRPLGCVSNG